MLSLFRQPGKISLRWVLVVPLVLQIVAIAGVTGYLSWRNGQETVQDLADRLMDKTTERISDRIDTYLETPHKILQLNRLAHSNGNLNLTDFKQLEEYFWQQINVFDRITAIGFGNEQGQYLGLAIDRGGILAVANAKLSMEVNRSQNDRSNTYKFYLLDEQGDRIKVLKSIPNYDPRTVYWYQTAQKARKQTWTPIVPYFMLAEASLFAVTPMYQNGELQGVMFVDLLLEDISRFLDNLNFSPSGQALIIERSGNLVATSTQEKPFVSIEGLDLKRLPAIDSQDPLTRKAMQSILEQPIDLTEITEIYDFRFKSDRQTHFAQITPYQDRHGLDWLIVAIVPESDFAAQISANTRQSLWLSVGAMGIAVAIYSAIAEWIALPIRTLSEHSAAMAQGDLNQQMPESSRIREIDRMAGSFNQMAGQLRQSFDLVQASLRQAETKYAKIFENSPDSIDLTSLEDGRWIDVNPSFLRLTGYTRDEVIGHTVAELNILVNPEQLEAIAHQLQTTGIVRNQQVHWRNKSGEIKLSLASCEIIQIDGQSYVLSISKEIGHLKQAQAALVESEAKLRQLTENLPLFLGLRTVNNDRWLYVNRGFEQITGGTVQEMYDNPLAWQNYIYPPDQEVLLANKPLPYPTETWTADFRIVRTDGTIRWLRSTLYPIKDETGEIYRICTIAEDITDRKHLELALEASEHKLHEIINTPIAAIVRIQIFANQDWKLDYISAGSATIFGYTPQEFITDRSIWMANIHPEDLETTILPLFAEIFQEKTTRFEYRFTHKDGSLRWLSAQFTAKYDPESDCWFVNQITLDISDRKQAELALAQQKQREKVLNQVIQNIHQSLDLSIIFSNTTRGIAQLMELDRAIIARYFPDPPSVWRHISAYRQDQQMPDDLGLEIPDRGNPLAAQLKQNQVVKIEDTKTIDDPINQKLAEDCPGAWLLVPITVNGIIWGSLSVWKKTITCWSEEQVELARRITQPLGIAIHQANLYQQSEQAKATVKQLETQWRTILKNAPSFISRVDRQGQFLFINRVASGFSVSEVIGTSFYDYLTPESQALQKAAIEQVFDTGETVSLETSGLGENQQLCDYTVRIAPIYDDNNQVESAVIIATDISDRKQAEIALTQAKEAAEAANRAKSEFLTNMSHEIRTPLNAMLSFTDLLSRKVPNPEHRNYLNMISSSGQSLLALINDILDLSKIEAGKLAVDYEPMDLHQLIIEISQMFNQMLHQKKIFLNLIILDSVPKIILFDPVRLRQIFFNVVGNAIKFTQEGYITIHVNAQTVETSISSQKNPDQINLEIQVVDTGIGIATEQQERIFESFVQSDAKTTRKYGGTGLGLAITKRLTHLLGGTVKLTSEVGKGTTLRFNFPEVKVLKSRNLVPSPSRFDENLNQFKPATILVVDYLEFNRALIAEYFAETKHHLLFATNGSEAMNQVLTHFPDLILLDLWMPDMNGLEVAKSLKQNSSTQAIPIIFITGSSQTEYEVNVEKLTEGFIRKPFSISQIVTALKAVIEIDRPDANYSETEPETPTQAVTIFNPSSEILAKLPELWEILQKQKAEVWPELCRTHKQRDLKAFVSRLQGWAEEYQCQVLWEYAETFQHQLEEFDWGRIPLTLQEFPKVIEKIMSD